MRARVLGGAKKGVCVVLVAHCASLPHLLKGRVGAAAAEATLRRVRLNDTWIFKR